MSTIQSIFWPNVILNDKLCLWIGHVLRMEPPAIPSHRAMDSILEKSKRKTKRDLGMNSREKDVGRQSQLGRANNES